MTERQHSVAAVLCGLLLGLGGAGCATTASVREVELPQAVRSAARFEKEYVLGVDDQIEVVVQRVPEVSRQVVVRPDGQITLPLIDDIPAAGLTFRQLDARLTELFAKRLVSPEVSVIAVRVRPSVVYVAGEVNNPMAVAINDAPTAAQAIARAGGFRRSASTENVTIVRLRADGYLEAIPAAGAIEGEAGRYMGLRMAALQPDDMIIVPESGRSQFTRFLEDFVNRPLAGLTSVFSTYVNWVFLRELVED
jgi:polysaccharide export outer membrane protein